ncbi:MAG: LptE family protein [Weeksellaceae bacterium]
MNSKYLVLLLLIFTSCYSFTGSSLDPRIKTIKVNRFNNYSAFQLPNYAQSFTDDLQLRFDQRSQLSLTNSNEADIILEGEIIDMYETPVNIGSGDQANENRLTVKVRVNYVNNVQEEKSFVRTFSSYVDYEATQTLNQAAPNVLPEINTLIIDQIFTAIVADW